MLQLEEKKLDSFNQPVRVNIRTIAIFVVLAVGIYLIIPRLVDAEKAILLLKNLNKWWLILALCSEISSYISAAWLHGTILEQLGYKIPFKDRFRISSISAFAIHFFPVSSLGESALTYKFFRKKDVNSGSILLMLLTRAVLAYFTFIIIFLIGLVSVPASPHLSFSPKLIATIFSIFIVFLLVYLVFLYNNEKKFKIVFFRLIRILNFFFGILKKEKINADKKQEVFNDLHMGMTLFLKKRTTIPKAILGSAFYWIGDIACAYFVFLSFGYYISPGILIFGYGVANLVSMVSFIPGGLGINEGTMGLVFKALGVPLATAFMSVLVFRLFSFWIWIPIGLYSFISLRRGLDENP